MEFFDCNAYYGCSVRTKVMLPANTIEDLQREMELAGVKKAMVKRLEQFIGGTIVSNQILADDIKNNENLYGIWSLLPTHTHEILDPDDMIEAMKENRIFGWMLTPTSARYFLSHFSMRDWFELAIERNIPIFVDALEVSLDKLADIMDKFPKLTVILNNSHIWPSDRLYRPFVAEFPNIYIDLSFAITDGGIESFVNEYGSSKLLYGSNFPNSYFGANMLMIKCADVSNDDKLAIAGENMERIIKGVTL